MRLSDVGNYSGGYLGNGDQVPLGGPNHSAPVALPVDVLAQNMPEMRVRDEVRVTDVDNPGSDATLGFLGGGNSIFLQPNDAGVNLGHSGGVVVVTRSDSLGPAGSLDGAYSLGQITGPLWDQVRANALGDQNGNEILEWGFGQTAAVNHLQAQNNQSGTPPALAARGGDTNIDMILDPKGTGVIAVGHGNTSADLFTLPGTFRADSIRSFITFVAFGGSNTIDNPPRQYGMISVTDQAGRIGAVAFNLADGTASLVHSKLGQLEALDEGGQPASGNIGVEADATNQVLRLHNRTNTDATFVSKLEL